MSLAPSAFEQALARVDDGHRRVLVWGPPGAEVSSLLAAIARERPCDTIEARSQSEAREALRAPRDARPCVVGWVSRFALEAEAYVECAPASLEACVQWLDAALVREGVALAHEGGDRLATLRALALAAERSTDGLRSALPLLRVLSPSALLARCEAARRAVRRGERATHPLLGHGWPATEALSTDELEAMAVIVASSTSVELDAIERALGQRSALVALAGLRDRSMVFDDGVGWVARFEAALALLDEPAFSRSLRAEIERVDHGCARRARDAIERWRTVGDPAALVAIDAERSSLEAAAASLGAQVHDAPRCADFVTCSVALALAYERHEGLGLVVSWLEGALSKLQPRSELWATVAVELARAHRLRTEWREVAALLDGIDVDAVSLPVASACLVERAFLRRFDDAERARALMLRAQEGYLAVGYAHEHAQCEIGLGSLAYWQERLAEALAHYEAARELAAKLGARKAEAVASTNMCLCLAMLGDDAAATAAGSQAVAHFRALGEGGAEGTTLGHLGMIALQRGQWDQAECRFVEAEALLERAGYLEQLRNARLNRAEGDFARGRYAEALSGLERVEALLAVRPDAYSAVHVAALRADVFEASGRYAEALAALDRGLREGATHASTVAALIAPRRARLLARAGQHVASAAAANEAARVLSLVGSPEHRMAATIVLGHAAWLCGEREQDAAAPSRSTLARALAPAWVGLAARRAIGESVLESLPIRHAATLYWADLTPSERTAIEWSARDPSCACVCIDEALGVARLPGGASLTRSARRNAFQLVVQLAGCEAGRTNRELVEALWPNERIQRAAASNRLNNAVAQLRALGGGALVRREGERYWLRSDARVVRSGVPWITTAHRSDREASVTAGDATG
ncbi:MAG: hypothetical protein JNK05_36230 [Myxococcales bacterium]|nr:hypothetical protein [Myxococcales bacterium]